MNHLNHSPHHSKSSEPSNSAVYTCPMHPEIRQDKPGICPKCGMALEKISGPSAQKEIYTCPMHPEIQQDHPGLCPICGMTLELKEGAVEVEDSEYRDMLRRFWIGVVLTIPILILTTSQMFPSLGLASIVSDPVSRWIQFIISTPIVLWSGWPFFEKAWYSVLNR